MQCIWPASIIVIFYLRVPLLWIEYLKKGKVLEAEIFRVFITHLGLHNGKISSKSVRSIEHVVRHLCHPYRALPPRDVRDQVFLVPVPV